MVNKSDLSLAFAGNNPDNMRFMQALQSLNSDSGLLQEMHLMADRLAGSRSFDAEGIEVKSFDAGLCTGRYV